MRIFRIENLEDVKEMYLRGYKPFDIYLTKTNQYLRFVYEDVNDARKVYEEIKAKRLSKK